MALVNLSLRWSLPSRRFPMYGERIDVAPPPRFVKLIRRPYTLCFALSMVVMAGVGAHSHLIVQVMAKEFLCMLQ